ncbi:uncharacterized protein [Onthophagus taurus]|uniref:uncharacterized protein n=1 Tax=Onthophagus taurus TaxID=166361 RepID=UPI0039BE1756
MENGIKSDDKIKVDEANEKINVEKNQQIETPEESSLSPTDNNNEVNNNFNNTENDVGENESALIIENNIDGTEKSIITPENQEISVPQTALIDDSEQLIAQPTLLVDVDPKNSESNETSSLQATSVVDAEKEIQIQEQISPDSISDDNKIDADKGFVTNSEMQEPPTSPQVQSSSLQATSVIGDEEKEIQIEEQILPDSDLVNNAQIHETQTSPQVVQIPENIFNLDNALIKLIKQHAISLGFQDVTVDVTRGTDLGDNFMGYIGKLTIKGKKNETNEENVMNWVIKTAPNNELYRTLLKVSLLYTREAYVYEHVFPIFKNFQLEKKILKPFQEYPQLIFTTLEPMIESIVMEDMKSIGYSMTNRQEPLGLNYIKLVMKTYAKFHAISYALRDQKPDVFKTLTGNVEDIIKETLHEEMAYKTQGPMIMSALESLDPVKDARAIIKFKKFAEKFVEIVKTTINKVNHYSVIGHGDSWTNNILWKYEDPNNPTIPTKVCLLDWQVARYGSPALDLSYFLFTCTDKEFRDHHYDDMIRLYYYTLCDHLNALGSDPEVLLPFDVLQKELKEFSVVGMYMSIFVLFICTRETEEMAEWRSKDVKSEDVSNKWATKSVNANKYQRRVRDVIVDVFEKGYLDCIM